MAGTENDAAAKDIRNGLESLNQSLWLSDLAGEVSMVIPMDTPTFGQHALIDP